VREPRIGFFYGHLLETAVPNDCLGCGRAESILNGEAIQDDLYREAADKFGSSLERLARAYEADPERRRDLSQDIHFQLWRSFQRYDARCSLRTWVYPVAHHVAASRRAEFPLRRKGLENAKLRRRTLSFG
jgi:DNA-directed RNA polymerase specialized sigma24 family protein